MLAESSTESPVWEDGSTISDGSDNGLSAVKALRHGQAEERERLRPLRDQLIFAFGRLKAIRACAEFDHDRCFDVESGREILDLAMPCLVEIHALSGERHSFEWCVGRLSWFLPGVTAELGREGLLHEWSRQHEIRSIAVANQFANPTHRGKPLYWLPTKTDIVAAFGLTPEKIDAINARQKQRNGKVAIRFGAGEPQTPEQRRARQKACMADLRRRNGMKPQSERTKTKELEILAALAGCSLSTIQRHTKKGTIDAFLSKKGVVRP